ncbi:methyltransferase domain-containing protein [Endobacter medicaginis]
MAQPSSPPQAPAVPATPLTEPVEGEAPVPVTPQVQPAPASARAGSVWDAVGFGQTGAELDRLRLRSDAVEKRLDQIEGWARNSAERTSFVESMVADVDGFRMARARQIAGQQRMTEKFIASLAGLAERIDAFGLEIEAMQARIAAIETGQQAELDRMDDRLTAFAERQDMLQRVMSGRSQQIRRIDRTIGLLGGEADHSAAAPGPVAGGLHGHALDLLYLAFEDRARGSRDEIKARQAVFLPLVEQCGAGTADRPVLDLGAGRGEWLELLRERGLVARGVDTNEAMVALCASLDIDCADADALGALVALPDELLGMISGFHVIEHLPHEVFVSLLDEALRVLKPGGVLLLETPDPQNVLVGSHGFYMDPTHRNPLPSAMVRIIAEARGFADVEIRRLNPSPTRFAGQDRELAAQLDELFYGPQDYAVIGRKI